jgi:hypothetical protein
VRWTVLYEEKEKHSERFCRESNLGDQLTEQQLLEPIRATQQ